MNPEDTPLPTYVQPVPLFYNVLDALIHLTDNDDPPIATVRSNTTILIIYGFGYASGSGFGSTLLKHGSVYYLIGT